MKTSTNLLLSFVLLATAAILSAGCSDPGNAPSGDWKKGLDKDVVKALSELSDADRTAALAQKTCPVTDKPLGSMGKPHKVTVKGQDVFLCCAGCEADIKENPEKYLAKLMKE